MRADLCRVSRLEQTSCPDARLSQSDRGIDGREAGYCLRWSGARTDNFSVSRQDSKLPTAEPKYVLSVRTAIGRDGALRRPRPRAEGGTGGTANLAVLGGNLPPSCGHRRCSPFSPCSRRAVVGLVARQNGQVARPTP